MADPLRFDGQTVVVTGAGIGIGRAYALGLAARGARVLVNDLGTSLQGAGASGSVAEQVVTEIRAAGGEAEADHHDVSTTEGASAIIDHALDRFGSIEAVVCNAGISRHAAFDAMTMDEFRTIAGVHLFGTAGVVHAAWPHMKRAGYGRVVMTTSAAGLWGVHEVAPYCAGKAAIVGLCRSLAHEGLPLGIRVNAVSPAAKTRMSQHLFGAHGDRTWRPELVEPIVTYLASRACRHNGAILAAMYGHFAAVDIVQARGAAFDPQQDVTAEMIVAELDRIDDMSEARTLAHGREAGRVSFEAGMADGR